MRYCLGFWTVVEFDDKTTAIAVSQTWISKLLGRKVIISKENIDKECKQKQASENK